jgi:DNA polymerase-3 subunit delta'
MPYAERKGDEKRGRNIRVVQIRWLDPLLRMAPSLSPRRIIIIDAADDLEVGAANALLKSLEEPPAHTSFFLISHAPGRLLPTIRSRCRVLRFAPLGDVELREVLRDHMPRADPAELDTLAAAGAGRPGKALAFAGLDFAAIDQALADIAQTGDHDNAVRAALAAQLSLKSALPRYEAFLKRAPEYVAAHARTRTGAQLERALDIYAEISQIAATAPIHNLDPQSAVFEICGLVAGLAPR